MTLPISIPQDKLEAFCKKWKITELALFGSVLRDDFGPESDVDVMVVFSPVATDSYFDWPVMQDELGAILGGRAIHLVQRKCIRNPYIRSSALSNRRVLYAA